MAAVTMESTVWHTCGGVAYDVGEQYDIDDETHKVGEISLLETLQLLRFAKPIETGAAVATGATAGTPGTWTPPGSTPRANLAAMAGCTATPATAWTTGQHVVMGDAASTYWDGAAWVAGQAA